VSLVAILALALLLAVVWRLARFAVKLLLLGALIVLIASYRPSATTHHPPTRSVPPGQKQRPPVTPESPGLKHRSPTHGRK